MKLSTRLTPTCHRQSTSGPATCVGQVQTATACNRSGQSSFLNKHLVAPFFFIAISSTGGAAKVRGSHTAKLRLQHEGGGRTKVSVHSMSTSWPVRLVTDRVESACTAKREMNLTSAVVKPTAASVYPRSIVCSTVPRYAVRSDVHGADHCGPPAASAQPKLVQPPTVIPQNAAAGSCKLVASVGLSKCTVKHCMHT